MFTPPPETMAGHRGTGDALAWCAWESVRKDDNWLISFVDLLIILLATLVVLIGQMGARQPSPPTQEAQSPDAIPVETTTAGDRSRQQRSGRMPADARSSDTRLARLVQERFRGEITAVRSEHGVVLEISDAVLFDSARATLRASASPMLTRLAATLQESGDALVSVEGHTDNRPLQGGRFRSNWDLAAARADAVTHFLIDQGLAAGRLRSVSYGDTRPTADNGTSRGRAANRRVELRVEFTQD